MSEEVCRFYRSQLEGLEVEFQQALSDCDDELVHALCAVAVTCLLRLSGVP